jgi:nucleoside-diphosphate kinase
MKVVRRSSQSVLVLIKPDGMQKAVAGEVISLFLASGLRMTGLKLVQVPLKLASSHYGHLRKEFFFKEIVGYLMGDLHEKNPVVAMVFTGRDAVAKARRIAGATNPEDAKPTSVRGKFGRITTRGLYENLVHVSSDVKESRREIALWFKKNELIKNTS